MCEEALAVAGELRAIELEALARHWLLDLVELGELDEARRRTPSSRSLSSELQAALPATRRWPGLVWAALAGRFEEAEQLAHSSVRLAEHAPRLVDAPPGAAAGGPAEQGRLRELLPEIERCDGQVARRRGAVLPLAHLDAGDRDRAQAAYDRALEGGPGGTCTMLWLTATSALGEAAAELRDPEAAQRCMATSRTRTFSSVELHRLRRSVHRVLGRTAAAAGRGQARVHFEGRSGAARGARRRGAARAYAM